MNIIKTILIIIAISHLPSIYPSSFDFKTILPPLIYPCTIQPNDPELDKWREKFKEDVSDIKKILDSHPQITHMGSIESNNQNYRCLQFAIHMITGNPFIGEFIECPSFTSTQFDFKKFFTQVPTAQNGDLAMYGYGLHFAYILNENEFLSKFGGFPYIIKHPPHATPYEKFHFILRLLPKYQKNKVLLQTDVFKEIKMAEKRNQEKIYKTLAEIKKYNNQNTSLKK